MKKLAFSVVLMFLLSMLVQALPIRAQGTIVYVNPHENFAEVGQTFTIDIRVDDVVNLFAWQIKLHYDPAVLECVPPYVIYPPPWPPPRPPIPQYIIDPVGGYVTCYSSLLGSSSFSGSAVLCHIWFKCKAEGSSPLEFVDVDTYLLDLDLNVIPTAIIDGSFTSLHGSTTYVYEVNRNDTIYYITAYTNSLITNFLFNDTTKKVSSDIAGQTGTTGFCNLTIPKMILPISPLIDNEHGFVLLGNFTFIVMIDGEPICYTRTENATHNFVYFTYTHSVHSVSMGNTPRGDLNGDRKVDMKDIGLAAWSFGSYPESPRWNAVVDMLLRYDNVIDMRDIAIIAKNFGKSWLI